MDALPSASALHTLRTALRRLDATVGRLGSRLEDMEAAARSVNASLDRTEGYLARRVTAAA